jgi:lipoprotein-releasing system permease protein
VSRERHSRLPRLEWFVARRLVGARKRSYVSLVSSVSMWGLALGVASLIVIFSVTSGFEEVFREKILGVYPHLVVIGKGGDLPDWARVRTDLTDRPHLESVSAATYDEMMASHQGRRGGCIVKGIESENPSVIDTIRPFLVEGELDSLAIEPSFSLEGDTLTLSPFPGGSSFIVVIPAQGPLRIEQDLAEEEKLPRIRLLSGSLATLSVHLEGLLTELEFLLEPGAVTRYLEVADGEATLRVDGALHQVTFTEGNATLVLAGVGEQTHLIDCPSPPPGPAAGPGRACIVNLRERPVTVVLPEGRQVARPFGSLLIDVATTRRPGVVLGQELANRIEARVGDEIRLVSPLYAVPGMGQQRRSNRTIADSFTVVATLALGFYEYDAKLALIDFPAAQRLLHQGDSARWVEVRIDDLFESEQRGIELARILSGFSLLDLADRIPALRGKYAGATSLLPASAGPIDVVENVNATLRAVKFSNLDGEMALGHQDDYRFITWQEMNRPLFTSMKRQRIVLSLFFLIIIIVAAFNIVSSQVMIVKEKQGDIAILKAMGASATQVKRIFLLQGMSAGILGTLIGLVAALGICALLGSVGFPLDPKVYFVSQLPVHLRAGDVFMACGLSLVAIYVAVLVAARRAAMKSPVEGLRELE